MQRLIWKRDLKSIITTCKKIDGLIDLITVPKAEDSVGWKAQPLEFLTNIRSADVELELCDFLVARSRIFLSLKQQERQHFDPMLQYMKATPTYQKLP